MAYQKIAKKDWIQKSNFLYLRLEYLYINLACLFVCLYPINVKTAEPIGPKFFVRHLGTPGKVYEKSKFQIFVSIIIWSSLNFKKFWKSANFFVKIRELFLFCFTMYTKRTCSQLIKKMGAKRPLRLVLFKYEYFTLRSMHFANWINMMHEVHIYKLQQS